MHFGDNGDLNDDGYERKKELYRRQMAVGSNYRVLGRQAKMV